ncbi:hypothetical protein BGLA2_2590024 [Burkholderia gladioli]|nr:hypothetical protein BGLA2_2590024 [Burkholderia gladioli]
MRERGDPDPGRLGLPRGGAYRRGRHRAGLPADHAPGGRRRGDPVRHRAAGLGTKLDADRHDRRAGDHGRFPASEDSLLPASPDHARAGPGAGADRRAGARRRLGRQAAGVEPGAAEPATAVRDVAADPLGQRPPADAGQRDRPARAPVRLAAVRRDHRHQPAAGDRRGGLSGRRRAGFASFGEVKPDDAVNLFAHVLIEARLAGRPLPRSACELIRYIVTSPLAGTSRSSS